MAEEENDNLGEGEEITNVTSSDVSKVVDGDLTKVEVVGPDDSWAALEDIGVSKKMILNIVLLLVFLIGGAVYVILNLDNWFGNGDEVEVVENDVVVEEPVVVSNYVGDSDLGGLMSALIVGIEFRAPEVRAISSFGNDRGAISALSVGVREIFSDEQLVQYLDLLRRINNAYDTDVYNVVDQSLNRREALDAHIGLLSGLIQEGSDAVLRADQDLASLRLRFETLVVARDLYEAQFFNALDLFSGEAAQENFEAFVAFSTDSQILKARFNALGDLTDRLDNSLNFLRPRYQDILVNQDAILKGVRVFDIPNSEIDAIINVDGN